MIARLILFYFWLGLGFVWIGALFANACYPESCPFAIAGLLSAGAIWSVTCNLKDIFRNQ